MQNHAIMILCLFLISICDIIRDCFGAVENFRGHQG